jgi:hypothetical protein
LKTDDYGGISLGLPILRRAIGLLGAREAQVEVQKVQLKGKSGSGDIALKLICYFYGIEIALKQSSDDGRKKAR